MTSRLTAPAPPSAVSAMDWTPEQRRAIESDTGPTIVVAGAGSGKTRVLVERYLRLLSTGTPADRILAVTFTNAAADEIRARACHRLGDEGRETAAAEVARTASLGTIHALCRRIVEEWGPSAGLPALREIREDVDLAPVFDKEYARWLEALSGAERAVWGSRYQAKDVRVLARLWVESRHALERLPAPAEEPHRTVALSLSRLARAIDVSLLDEGRYGFEDLEAGALRVVETCRPAREALAARFAFLLVDEFQDTSPVQWRILGALLGEDWRKLFVVGDPKQAIYGFRGADVRLFLDVKREAPGRGGEVIELATTFRATPGLTAEINALAAPLFEGSAVPFTPLVPGRDGVGEIQALVRTAMEPVGSRAEGKLAEVGVVVARASELARAGRPGDVAIITRASELLPAFAAGLEAEGIPAVTRAGRGLFDHLDVVDVASYLRALADPGDDFRVAAFLRSGYVRFSEAELLDAVRRPGATLLEKVLADPRLKGFLAVLETKETSVAAALRALFAATGRFPSSTSAVLVLFEALDRAGASVADTPALLDAWEREAPTVEPEAEPDTDAVRLMTAHGAKGLEFRHVILADLARGPNRSVPLLRVGSEAFGLRYREGAEFVPCPVFEGLQAVVTERELEESSRVLYVALTRARESVTLIVPEGKPTSGSWAGRLRNV